MSHTIAPVVRRQTIADALRRTALRLPRKTGIVCGSITWTYAEFDALVSRLVHHLEGVGLDVGQFGLDVPQAVLAVIAAVDHGSRMRQFSGGCRG